MSMAAQATHHFDDAGAYERFMGQWSRAAVPGFLDWIDAPRDARWLDVGCGTGILAEEILRSRAPSQVWAVDPAAAQAEQAASRLRGRANVQVAAAEALPFGKGAFDVVAAALVINFVADARRAVLEMRRVARAGGIVAGFVWDFARNLSPSGPMRRGLEAAGVELPAVPGTARSTMPALHTLFEEAGLGHIEARAIEVTRSYRDFDDFWAAQTPAYSPSTKAMAKLSPAELHRAREAVRSELPVSRDGRIEYAATANAIKALA